MDADVIVIGAGIAGASAACELAATHRVLLVEREDQPGYHTTGRSAALYIKSYGNAQIRALTLASGPFYTDPPPGFSEAPLLAPRGALLIARPDQLDLLAAELDQTRRFVPSARRLGVGEALELVPSLRADYLAAAMLDPDARDMDVGAILGGYLRGFRRRGGRVVTGAGIEAIARDGGTWTVSGREQRWTAPIIVDAAGAWADEVAGLAGLGPLGLVPKRRTAFLIEPPAGADIQRWPMVCDIAEQFYLKPDAGKLLCSPADETPSPPTDAQADEMDVAVAVERIERAFAIDVRRITHRWAGLRTFAADKTLVCGFDPRAEGFFWLAGQGGYGIQTAPAMACLTATLVRGEPMPEPLQRAGVAAEALAPGRLL
jgi:D-arginine dehydrogenase